jgi:hypothetical protein
MIDLELIQNGALAVICFLACCIFVMAFGPPAFKRKTFDELAREHDRMVKHHAARSEEMIAVLVERLADNRMLLEDLYKVPENTIDVIQQRAKLYCDIRDDEKLLRELRQFGIGRRVIPVEYDLL